MNAVWDTTNALLDKIEQRASIRLRYVGFGFSSACLCWLLIVSRNAGAWGADPGTIHWCINAGEVAGFFGAALLSLRAAPCFTKAPFLFGAPTITLTGAAMVEAAIVWMLPSQILAFGCAVAAFGYAVQLLLWLEFYGTLAPRCMLLAYGLSYGVELLTWLLFDIASVRDGFLLCVVSIVLTQALLVSSWRQKLPAEPLAMKRGKRHVPWKLFGWLFVFALAYGLGDSITGMGHTTFISKLGTAIPMLVAALCAFFLVKRLDITTFYAASFGFMLSGLICLFFSNLPLGLSQVLISAASQSSRLVGVFVLCPAAYRARSCAIPATGIMYGGILVAMFLGKNLGLALQPTGYGTAGCVVVLVTAVMATALLLSDRRLRTYLSLSNGSSDEQGGAVKLAGRLGLSDRESTVFLLMVQGKTTAQISEELFIAKSTVRAHISRIYEKAGIHTKQEFLQITEELV